MTGSIGAWFDSLRESLENCIWLFRIGYCGIKYLWEIGYIPKLLRRTWDNWSIPLIITAILFVVVLGVHIGISIKDYWDWKH